MNSTNDLIRRGDAIDAVFERIKQIGFEENADVLSIRQAVREVSAVQPEPITVYIDHELTQEEYEKLRKDVANAPIMLLPSAQPENADCAYCHEDSDGYVKPIEKNCHAFIRFGMNGWEISLSAKGWNGSAKIMHCPMCGRRLKKDK